MVWAKAASTFRTKIYEHGFLTRKQRNISKNELLQRFIELSLKFLDNSIKANKREDNLYHAYNLMTLENDKESFYFVFV